MGMLIMRARMSAFQTSTIARIKWRARGAILPQAKDNLQVLLAPTNGLVSIPFAALSLLTSIIACAIFDTDPIRKGTSILESLILSAWPMAPVTYFVKMADAGSPERTVLILLTALMVHVSMTVLAINARRSYFVTSPPVYS
ncbi:hypothetical protein CcaCcLH18_00860 [Colletotrichum camelliae]|nr:hypothetical protein CcaCcLH18_00860 [Colletotrichum camelliae]